MVCNSLEEVAEDGLPKPQYSDSEASAAAATPKAPPMKTPVNAHGSGENGMSGKGNGRRSDNDPPTHGCAPDNPASASKEDISPGGMGWQTGPVTGSRKGAREATYTKHPPGMGSGRTRVSATCGGSGRHGTRTKPYPKTHSNRHVSRSRSSRTPPEQWSHKATRRHSHARQTHRHRK